MAKNIKIFANTVKTKDGKSFLAFHTFDTADGKKADIRFCKGTQPPTDEGVYNIDLIEWNVSNSYQRKRIYIKQFENLKTATNTSGNQEF